jgi:hypothetical protein
VKTVNRSKRSIVRAATCAALLPSIAAGCSQKDASIQPEQKPTASAAAVESPPTPGPDKPAPDKPGPDKPAPVAPIPARISGDRIVLHVFAGKPGGTVYASQVHHIFPVGDRMVVRPGLQVLQEGRLVDMPGVSDVMLAGEDKSGGSYDKPLDEVEVLSVMGRYPDDLWLDVTGGWGFSMARSLAGTWVERRYTYLRQFGKFGRVPDQPVAAGPWSKRRTLAYLGPGRFRLALNNRQKPDPLPRQAAGKSCPTRVEGKAMMSLPDGRVAVVGPDCDAEGALALERWGTGSDEESLSKSEVVPLPGAPGDIPAAVWVLLRDDVTYAVARYQGKSYLAEIRGDRAVEIEAPHAHVAGAYLAADGTLFLATDQTVYRYEGVADQKATFTAAELPKKLQVKKQHGLFAEARDRVYWAVEPETGSVILSSRKPAEEPPAPSAAPAATADPALSASASPQATASASVSASALLDTFPALADACTTPLVVLFPVARSTPKDFDFAATIADLKDYAGLADIELVEIERDGERFLAAVVKDTKSAAALVAYWQAKKKEPAPRATCFAVPAGARRIR